MLFRNHNRATILATWPGLWSCREGGLLTAICAVFLLPSCLPGERSNDPLPDVKADTSADAGKADGSADAAGDAPADGVGPADAATDTDATASDDASDGADPADGTATELPAPTGCFADADCAGVPALVCRAAATCNLGTGLCEPGAIAEGEPCVSANPCLTGTTCDASGACAVGTLKNCGDGNDCTWDSCQPSDGTCTHLPVPAACNDGNKCSQSDHCEGSSCVGSPVVCAPTQNACEFTKCEPSDGKCYAFTYGLKDKHACVPLNPCDQPLCDDNGGCGLTKDCDDGNFCTYDGNVDLKTCACTHSLLLNPPECSPSGQFDAICALPAGVTELAAATCVKKDKCNDGVACTIDSYNTSTKACAHLPETKGTECDDGHPCTAGTTCDGKTKCGGGTLDNTLCDDYNGCTVDQCAGPLGCTYTSSAGNCNDGTGCTTGDSCQDGKCTGTALNCDDANACTVDACSGSAGCTHVPVDDGASCDTAGLCEQGICKAP